MFFPHNLLPIMFFARMWSHSYFSQNVLPIMFFFSQNVLSIMLFFPRMCCKSYFFPECAVNQVLL
jgi:hypothetical protein